MTELISDQKKFRKLKEDPVLKGERALQRTLREINKKIYLVILNIQIYILKVLNQLDSMEHLKYTKLFCQVLFLLFDLLSLQSALITESCSVLRLPCFTSYAIWIFHKRQFYVNWRDQIGKCDRYIFDLVWCNESIYKYPIVWSNWYCNQFNFWKQPWYKIY